MRSINSLGGYVVGQPKAFALTESGRNLFTRFLVQLDKFEVEQLSGISQQDLAVTRSVLEKLYGRLRLHSDSVQTLI